MYLAQALVQLITNKEMCERRVGKNPLLKGFNAGNVDQKRAESVAES